jgi:hypothetical protein
MSDSEYYKRLKEDPPKKKEKPKHKGNWSVIVWVGGKVQTAMSDKPYAMCVHKKKAIQAQSGIGSDRIKIVPFVHDSSTNKAPVDKSGVSGTQVFDNRKT